jgi:hypothetical protein
MTYSTNIFLGTEGVAKGFKFKFKFKIDLKKETYFFTNAEAGNAMHQPRIVEKIGGDRLYLAKYSETVLPLP